MQAPTADRSLIIVVYTSFILLAVSILAVWLPPLARAGRTPWPWWPWPYAAAVLCAYAGGALQWPGLLSILATLLCALGARHAPHAGVRAGLTLLCALLCLALALHQLPGFTVQSIFSAVLVSADARPVAFSLSFDSPTAALVLLVFFSQRITRLREIPALWPRTLAVMAASTVVVMGAGVMVGYVGWDPKLPALSWAYFAKMLLVTCVMEEGMFRGLIQERLARWFATRTSAHWPAVVIAAILFGLVHAAGGQTFIALATLAGLGYGTAYAVTGRIEAAILTHFTVNAVHFLCFTYPHL